MIENSGVFWPIDSNWPRQKAQPAGAKLKPKMEICPT
jgi:hypothetical protein